MDTTRSSLLERIRDPDNSSAWAEFDSIYRPIVYRFARRFGLGRDEADEAVQLVMFRISRRIRKFQYEPRKGRFRGWLFRLTERQVKDLRARRKLPTAESGELRGLADRETPQVVFERIWEEEHLKHCLELVRSEVGAATYQAYHLHVVEEVAVEEVCRRLGMTPNQVYKIKWRVTRKLIERCKNCPDMC